jgi:hypothetical protein
MDLLENPFYLLKASPLDRRSRLIELADAENLLPDPEQSRKAYSILNNPQKRLSAEAAYLPAVNPDRYGLIFETLISRPGEIIKLKDLPKLARCNLLAAAILRLTDYDKQQAIDFICQLSAVFEEVFEEVLKSPLEEINNDRLTARFPEVTDLAAIEEEISQRRKYFGQVINAYLNNFPPQIIAEILTDAINETANLRPKNCPIILNDLMDIYEEMAQDFLGKEEANIVRIADHLRISAEANKPETYLESLVSLLIKVLKNWGSVARPIQLRASGQGKVHNFSLRLAGKMKDLSHDLFEMYPHFDFPVQLTISLREVLAEIWAQADVNDKDALEPEVFANNYLQNNPIAEKYTHEAKIGWIFKNTLRISPEGIMWKNKMWPLDSITRLRWDYERKTERMRFPKTFFILFGDNSKLVTIRLTKKDVYNKLADSLSYSIGFNIFDSYLAGLKNNQEFQIGKCRFNDEGVFLTQTKLFLINVPIFCPWTDLELSYLPGGFKIEKSGNKKVKSILSYLRDDNSRILQNMVWTAKNQNVKKISQLLYK